MSGPIEDAIREGEERAERQWAVEQREPFPDRLWPKDCRDGIHGEWVDIRTFGELTPQRMPARCPGCNQTWEAIE